jgi:hypothetical protein
MVWCEWREKISLGLTPNKSKK